MALQFPSDITNSGRYMTLRFEEYRRRASNAPAISTEPAGGNNTIRLPLPSDLVDSQRVQYSTSDKLGPVVGSILENVVGSGRSIPPGNIIEAGRTLGGAAAAGAVAALIEGGTQFTTGAIRNLSAGLAEPSQVRSAASQLSGIAINPFLSVSFETPQFKTHRFSWKMIPRDRAESDILRNIVTRIKTAMLPGIRNVQAGGFTIVGNNLLFDYPNVVDIFITPNEYMYQFKKCVITSFNVNYAPGNAPAFYRSNAPVAADIVIELQEIEYWTKADYGGTQTLFNFQAPNTTPPPTP